MAENVVIAIDGPAASGKSTVARMLAEKFGYVFVNSGAMYRAATWAVVEAGVDPADADAVMALLGKIEIVCGTDDGRSTISLDGVDPESHLRDEAVNKHVSTIATIASLRAKLVAKQREYANLASIIMEGRDIGSVVFPDTAYKFYVDASPEVREQRRRAQGHVDSVKERDSKDASRKASPLVVADDAHVVDGSHLTPEGVAGEVIGRLKLKGLDVSL